MESSKIIIVGKAASGKDHLRKILESRGDSYAVPYTSRPMRASEVDGKDYHFIDESKFRDLLNDNFFKFYSCFNNWFYGISIEQWNQNKIFIMTPSDIKKINPEERNSCFIIYIDIDKEIRRNRLYSRSDNSDSIERRLNADETDFTGFIDYDKRITNPNFQILINIQYEKQ